MRDWNVYSWKILKTIYRTVLFLCVLNLMLCLEVYASDVDSKKFIEKNNASITSICNDANKSVKANINKILVYDSANGVVSFSNVNYKKLDDDKKELFMRTALLDTKESGLGSQSKIKLYNFISDQDSALAVAIKFLRTDTSADVGKASMWFKNVTGAISTVLGVFCLVTFTLMSMSVVLDIAYIAIPIFRTFSDKFQEKYSKGSRRPFYISKEAFDTLLELDAAGVEYRNPAWLYMKRRAGVMVVVAVCLLYLVSGQIYDLFVWVLDLVGVITKYMSK